MGPTQPLARRGHGFPHVVHRKGSRLQGSIGPPRGEAARPLCGIFEKQAIVASGKNTERSEGCSRRRGWRRLARFAELSAIPQGIAVLGESDANSGARGGRAEDEHERKTTDSSESGTPATGTQ